MSGRLDLSGTIRINTSSASGAVRALDSRLIRLSQSGNTSSKTLKEVAAAQLTAQRAAEANARAVATLTKAQAAYNKTQQQSLAIRRQSIATAGLTNARASAVAGGAENAAAESQAKVILTENRAITEEARKQLVLTQQGNVESQIKSRTLRDQIALQKALVEQQRVAAASTAAMTNNALKSRVGINGLRSALGEVGTTLTHIGLISGLVFTGIIANAVSMQSEFAKVVRTSDIIEKSTKQLNAEGFKNQADAVGSLRLQFDALAQTLPISYKELTEIGAAANQLGVTSDNLASFTKTVAQFSATTGVSVDTASTAFGRLDSLIVNTGGHANGVNHDYQGLADAINKVGVNSVATDQQIINVSSQISGIANAAGLGYKDIIGFSGALASVNVSPYLARGLTTRLFSKITDAVSTGGTELAKFAQVSGLSAQEFTAAWKDHPRQVITDFFDGIRSSGGQAIKVLNGLGITSVLDQPAIIRLANAADKYGKSADAASRSGGILRQTFEDAATAAGENAKQYAVISNTVQARLQVAFNRVQVALRDIGESDLGPLTAAIGTLSDGVLQFSQGLDRPFKLLGTFKLPFTNGEVAGFIAALTGIAAVFTLIAAGGLKVIRTVLSVAEAFRGLKGVIGGSPFGAYITGANQAAAANERLALSATNALNKTAASQALANRFTAATTGRFSNQGANTAIATSAGAGTANNVRAIAGLTPQIQRMYAGLDNVNTATQHLNANTSAFGITGGRVFTAYAGTVDRLLASNNRFANSLGVLGSRGTTAFGKIRAAGGELLGTAKSLGSGISALAGGPIGLLTIGLLAGTAAAKGLADQMTNLGSTAGDVSVQIVKAKSAADLLSSVKVSAAGDSIAAQFDKSTRSFQTSAKGFHKALDTIGSGGLGNDFVAQFRGFLDILPEGDKGFNNTTDGLNKLDAGFKSLADSGNVDGAIKGIQTLFKGASKTEVDNALGHMSNVSSILNTELNKVGKTAGDTGQNLYALTQSSDILGKAIDTVKIQTDSLNAALKVDSAGFQDYLNATKTAASAAGDLNKAFAAAGKNASFGDFLKKAKQDMNDFVNSQKNALKIANDTGVSLAELSQLDPGILAGAVKSGKKGEAELAKVMTLKDAIANFQTGAGQLGNSPELLAAFEKLGPAAQDKIIKGLEDGDNIQQAFGEVGKQGVDAFNSAVQGADVTAVQNVIGDLKKNINNSTAVIKLSADDTLAIKDGEDAQAYLNRLKSMLKVDANTFPAIDAGETAAHYLDKIKSVMGLDANTILAIRHGESAASYLKRLKSVMTFDANTLPAIRKGESAQHYLDRLRSTIQVDAATERANEAIDRAARDRESTIYVNEVVRKNQELYNLTGHSAMGGPITGPGTGTSDSIPTMLSNGEYVIRASQAQKYRSLLDQINYGRQGYATGGSVTKGSASYEGTTVRVEATQNTRNAHAVVTTQLSAYDRHLLMVIADSVGVTIPADTVARANTTANGRQSRRGNG